VTAAGGTSCCGPTPADIDEGIKNVVSANLYTTDELQGLPQEAVVASLGCGNPVAMAALHEGEVVLDLGSGGGIDVLLSARRVGPKGKAYGLDMTDEMLDLARENQRKAGVTNVEFLRGEMENIPLPRNTVDVIISNCVVNLSPDKDKVLAEAHRVLKPGGRVAIADIVMRGQAPEALRRNLTAWAACAAGALEENDYRAKLETAGFINIEIEVLKEYTREDAETLNWEGMSDLLERIDKEGGEPFSMISAVVRAVKPGGGGKAATEAAQAAASKGQERPQRGCC
jgi:ubiquinone/menaquinone biosynthesis C-methylase UbiE